MRRIRKLIVLTACTLAVTGLTGCGLFGGKDDDGLSDDWDTDDLQFGDLEALPAEGREAVFDESRRNMNVSFNAAYFGYDSAQIGGAEGQKLERVAEYMRSDRTAHVVVEGHCDERGSREYNLTLGERRALSARQYLINLGADSSRVQTRSMGEERPASNGSDEGSHRLNRRAEFVVYN